VVIQRAGLVPTILGMGAIYLLVTLGMFFNRSLLQMDARELGLGRSGAKDVRPIRVATAGAAFNDLKAVQPRRIQPRLRPHACSW
jgi:hypothetical protein